MKEVYSQPEKTTYYIILYRQNKLLKNMELFKNKEKGNECPVFEKGGGELGLTAIGCIV